MNGGSSLRFHVSMFGRRLRGRIWKKVVEINLPDTDFTRGGADCSELGTNVNSIRIEDEDAVVPSSDNITALG